MHKPDFTGTSLVNLMGTLLDAMGGVANGYPLLTGLDSESIKDSRNIVLFVIDGLGYDYLTKAGSGSTLHQHLRAKLTSVFPSTTASAITTFMTGLAPQQHGLTGWHVYLKELGCVTAVLPFRPRLPNASFAQDGCDVRRLYDCEPLFNRIDRSSYVIAPELIIHSEYNVAHSGSAFLHAYDTMSGCFNNIANIIKSDDAKKYLYAYWPDFDRYSHEFGNASAKVISHFEQLDEMFTSLLTELEGTETTVLVTADHGFTDTEASSLIQLHDHPVMQDALLLPLCGEPRVAYCYIHPGKEAQFVNYVQDELGTYAELMPSQALIDGEFFGSGPMHSQLHNRIGHYALLMKENYIIKDWLLGESSYVPIGVHGGMSQEEMFVPFVVIEK